MQECPVSTQLLNALKDAWNRIQLHTKRPNIVCGWGFAPDPAGRACDAPRLTSRMGRGTHPPIPLPSTPFTAVIGHLYGGWNERWIPRFLKHGCALAMGRRPIRPHVDPPLSHFNTCTHTPSVQYDKLYSAFTIHSELRSEGNFKEPKAWRYVA